jgi:hypothetical protein
VRQYPSALVRRYVKTLKAGQTFTVRDVFEAVGRTTFVSPTTIRRVLHELEWWEGTVAKISGKPGGVNVYQK